MAWEVYKRKLMRVGEPSVTLSKMGRIAFNKIASDILYAKGVTEVRCLWDKDSQRCGIQIAKGKEDGVYPIKFGDATGNGAGFSAVTFMNWLKYDWTETRSFPADWDEENDMFVFSIPKEHFGSNGNLRQPLGRVKRPDRLKRSDRLKAIENIVEPKDDKKAEEPLFK